MSNARVRTFMNHIALAFEDHRDLLQGKSVFKTSP